MFHRREEAGICCRELGFETWLYAVVHSCLSHQVTPMEIVGFLIFSFVVPFILISCPQEIITEIYACENRHLVVEPVGDLCVEIHEVIVETNFLSRILVKQRKPRDCQHIIP